MAAGMALAEKFLATKYNKEGYNIVDHYTFVLCGDGDMQAVSYTHLVEKPKVSEPKKIVEEEPKEIYRMSEIISPMRGITKSKEPEKKVSKKTKVRPKRKLSDDELVPVLSPYFGNFEKKIEVETESKLTAIKEEKPDVKEKKPKVEKKINRETDGLPLSLIHI